MKVTAIVHTKNSSKTLKACLASLSFADELIVTDLGSTDETLNIAERYSANILHHQDSGYVEPVRPFSIGQASNDWIVLLDADEELSPQLIAFIKERVQNSESPEADVFFVARQNLIFKKWVEKTGWWPDYQPRIFNRQKITWKKAIHSVPEIKGSTLHLPAEPDFSIVHHNYETVEDYLWRINHYTSIHVQEQSSTHASTPHQLIKAFEAEFLSRLFAQKGISEGMHGTSLAILQAFYQSVIEMKVWQAQGFPETHRGERNTVNALHQFAQSLTYWVADWQVAHSNGLAKIVWKLRRKYKI